MPRLRNSLIELNSDRYRKMNPEAPVAHHLPLQTFPYPSPEPPIVIRRSHVLISSMPAISTNVDGISRQFYGGNLPTRRLSIP